MHALAGVATEITVYVCTLFAQGYMGNIYEHSQGCMKYKAVWLDAPHKLLHKMHTQIVACFVRKSHLGL